MSLQGSDAISFLVDHLITAPFDIAKLYTDFERNINLMNSKDLQKPAQDILTQIITQAQTENDLIAPFCAHLVLGQGEGKAILCLIDMLKASSLYGKVRAVEGKKQTTMPELRAKLKVFFQNIEDEYFNDPVFEGDNLPIFAMADIQTVNWALDDHNNWLPSESVFSPLVIQGVKNLAANPTFLDHNLEDLFIGKPLQTPSSLRRSLENLSTLLSPKTLTTYKELIQAMVDNGAGFVSDEDVVHLNILASTMGPLSPENEHAFIKILGNFTEKWEMAGCPSQKKDDRLFTSHQQRASLILDTLTKFRSIKEELAKSASPEKIVELLVNGASPNVETTQYKRKFATKVKDLFKAVSRGESIKKAASPPKRSLKEIAEISGPEWKGVQNVLTKQTQVTTLAEPDIFVKTWIATLQAEYEESVKKQQNPQFRYALKSIKEFIETAKSPKSPLWAKLDSKIEKALSITTINQLSRNSSPELFEKVSTLFLKLKKGLLPDQEVVEERADSIPTAYIPLATEKRQRNTKLQSGQHRQHQRSTRDGETFFVQPALKS